MPETNLAYLSATEALARFQDGSLRPSQLLEAILQQIDDVNPHVNAFTEVWTEEARVRAHDADRRYRDRTARPLEGVVLAVKDSTSLEGKVHTLGSALYKNNVAQKTHPGLQRLIDAGVVMVGRTTMPEFGEAGNCYTSLWGVTRNPWNLDYGPGGSSSGAGVAVAAGMTTISDGSDIGGSSRIPASCCGVFGYKPPYGRNPNTYEGSFDPYMHYGPITRTVADMALVQNVVSGQSLEDIGTLRDHTIVQARETPLAGQKILYSLDFGYFKVDQEVREALFDTLKKLEEMGCVVEELKLNWTEKVYEAWATMNAVKGTATRRISALEDPNQDELTDYVVDMLQRGEQATAADVEEAIAMHVAMYRDIGPALETAAAFICPTTSVPSIPATQSPLDREWHINDEPVSAIDAEGWFMTYPFNMLSQLPVLSVPVGRASNGVPIGLQIVGKSFADQDVFDVASALEPLFPVQPVPAFSEAE